MYAMHKYSQMHT